MNTTQTRDAQQIKRLRFVRRDIRTAMDLLPDTSRTVNSRTTLDQALRRLDDVIRRLEEGD